MKNRMKIILIIIPMFIYVIFSLVKESISKRIENMKYHKMTIKEQKENSKIHLVNISNITGENLEA
jgi:hypothetical protein